MNYMNLFLISCNKKNCLSHGRSVFKFTAPFSSSPRLAEEKPLFAFVTKISINWFIRAQIIQYDLIDIRINAYMFDF
jgi:hypothetical protein